MHHFGAALLAVQGRMWPMGCGLDMPGLSGGVGVYLGVSY